jgi:hypothetical protein
MIRICAWCHEVQQPLPGDDPEDKRETHGICPECLERVLAARQSSPAGEHLRRAIESLGREPGEGGGR